MVRDMDGGLYYESFDSFGGVSASAIGLCHYLLNYWEGGHLRPAGSNYGWNYTFFGSLPGASSVLYQNISQNSTATNGLEFAALFNERDGATPGQDNSEALTAITGAATSITSWPTNGGGMIQWSTAATNVNKNAGSVTVSLLRSGASTLPVKVSYTTYALTAGSSNYKTTSGIVSFAAGVTSQKITVPILNDGLIDPTLRFSLELISASGGAWLGNQLSSVVSILDTNTPPKFTGQPVIQANGNFQFQFVSSAGAGSNRGIFHGPLKLEAIENLHQHRHHEHLHRHERIWTDSEFLSRGRSLALGPCEYSWLGAYTWMRLGVLRPMGRPPFEHQLPTVATPARLAPLHCSLADNFPIIGNNTQAAKKMVFHALGDSGC